MEIGRADIRGKVVLAPLAEITDSPFRLLCRRFGAAMVFTGMISADGLVRDNPKTRRCLLFGDEERPLAIQLFGAKPEVVAEAARMAAAQRPDFIDLNFGCPAKKVVRRGAGAALLKDLRLLKRMIRAVVEAVDVPVMVKMRSGWDGQSIVVMEAAQIAEECGAVAVIVHPRTQNMQLKGRADWNLIAEVKRAVSIPVIGNGDISSAEGAKRMLDETGCDGVMIGRAAVGNPWIFKLANHFLENGRPLPPPTMRERIEVCLEHARMMVGEKGETIGVQGMRRHYGGYTKRLSRSARLRNRLMRANRLEEVEKILQDYERVIYDRSFELGLPIRTRKG